MKKTILEYKDPNEYVDDEILNKKILLDGENLDIFNRLKNWGESFEREGNYITQADYNETKKKIFVTVQELKNEISRYLIISYDIKQKTFEIKFYHYHDRNEKMGLIHKNSTNSPSTLNTLLIKYKNILMKNKQPLTEAKKEREYTEIEINSLIQKVSADLAKLMEAVKPHLTGSKFLKQVKEMYREVTDTPSLATLKAQFEKENKELAQIQKDKLRNAVPKRPVVEETGGNVKVSSKADAGTITKAQALAKTTGGDIELVEESTRMTLKEFKNLIKESSESGGEEIVTDAAEIKRFVDRYNNAKVAGNGILQYSFGYQDRTQPGKEVAGVIQYDDDGENGQFRYVVKNNGKYSLKAPMKGKYIYNPDALMESLGDQKKK